MVGEGLHSSHSARKFPAGIPQGGLRVNFPVACQVHEGKEKVAELRGESRFGGTCPDQFADFLVNLRRDSPAGIRPIKACPGSTSLEVLGVKQCGKMAGDAVEAALAGGLFLLLELVPATEDLRGVSQLFPAKDVGMPADQFFRQFPGHSAEIEGFSFPGQLGVKKDVKEDIPQFFPEGMIIPLVDGLEELVYLLQNHGTERAMGLLPVPRASPRATQSCHDLGEVPGFAHPSPLRAARRFVEPERDEPCFPVTMAP